MGRRHVILIAVMVALGLLVFPAAPVLGRVPELVLPTLVGYGIVFFVVYRITTGRSLPAEGLAAAGLRERHVARGRAGRAVRVLLAVVISACVLLMSASAAMWMRSGSVEDRVEWDRWDVLAVTPSRWVRRFHDRTAITSARGAFAFDRERQVTVDPRFILEKDRALPYAPWRRLTWSDTDNGRAAPMRPTAASALRMPPNSPALDALGIEYNYSREPQSLPTDPWEGTIWLVVPWWLICLAFALVPLCTMVVYLMRLRRIEPGHCRNCGYDLRATPGRCPECGEEYQAKNAMAAGTSAG